MAWYDFLRGPLAQKQKDPFAAASKYLNQIGPMAEQRLNPYIERGNEAGNQLYGQYQNLTNNPGDIYNQLMSGYSHSTGFDTRQKNALQAQANSAAAGGYRGTPEDQRRQAEIADSLLGADMDTYFRNVHGLYGQGLSGLGGFENQGYGANEDLTSILGNLLSNKGQMAYQGVAQGNQNRSDKMNSLIKLLGQAAGAYATGGASLAAPGGGIW